MYLFFLTSKCFQQGVYVFGESYKDAEENFFSSLDIQQYDEDKIYQIKIIGKSLGIRNKAFIKEY